MKTKRVFWDDVKKRMAPLLGVSIGFLGSLTGFLAPSHHPNPPCGVRGGFHWCKLAHLLEAAWAPTFGSLFGNPAVLFIQ